MKLIVTIPAYNEEETIERAIGEVPRTIPGIDKIEVLVCDDGSTDRTAEVARRAGADHIVRLRRNFGLTIAFGTALQSAVERGADIIVNFDADCQYVGAEIATLVAPILRGEADMVSGDRGVPGLEHMSASKKYGNRIGSYMLRTVAGSGVRDASSGFRAFSRECALRLNPYIGHTYTHQTLIQARHNGMVVKEVPVTFRPSARPNGGSRLISGVAGHVLKSGGTIIRTMTTYRPLSILGGLGLLLVVAGGLVGLIPIINWLQQGNTEGHLQSLIASVVLLLMGLQLLVLALLADVVSANRRLTEEVLYRLRAGKEPDSAIVPPLEESLPVQPAAAEPGRRPTRRPAPREAAALRKR